MAFAGNDLVNFIGVPLAGYNSFKAWAGAGASSPDSFTMEMLAGKVGTPTFMLLTSTAFPSLRNEYLDSHPSENTVLPWAILLLLSPPCRL